MSRENFLRFQSPEFFAPLTNHILRIILLCGFFSLSHLSVKTSTRFTSLAWGMISRGVAASCANGLVVGGMSDGSVCAWDARGVIAGEGDASMLMKIERHQAPVRTLAFNPHPQQQHLLAAASADGDISIISMENTSTPTIAK